MPQLRLIRTALALGVFALAPSLVSAAPLVEDSTEVSFPETRTAGGIAYRCLGTGVRKVLFFKVYANTFCIDASNASAILKAAVSANAAGKTGEALADTLEESAPFFRALFAAKADKLVVMHMVRNVSKEKLANAFEESLGKILSKESIGRLIGAMTADAKDGQEILFFSQGSKVSITIGGKTTAIDDAEIAAKIWRVWLGPSSVTPALREDIAARAAK